MRSKYVTFIIRLLSYRLLSLILCFGLLTTANCQIQLGSRLSVNLAKKTSQTYSDPYRVGVSAGIFIERHARSKIILLSDIGYSLKGNSASPGNFNLKYLTGNFLLGYDFTARFSMLVGPEFGYLLRVYYKNGGYRVYDTELFSKFDLGLETGMRYKLSENIGIVYSYIHGLHYIQKPVVNFDNGYYVVDKEGNPKNKVHQVGLFILFKTYR